MIVVNQRQRIQSLPYKKSSKFSRNRIIMNDLYVDCGYPQQIITYQSRPHTPQNYIQDNKKNLKNFFKDRLPYDQLSRKLHKQNKIQFDSQRVFQIKTQQLQRKSQTKMVLNNTFLENKRNNTSFSNKRMKKVQQIFLVNDKTLEFKNKFQSLNMNRLRAYNKDNHRRQTHSFMEKRSNLLKKQAYEKVFGMDSALIARTTPVSPNRQDENQSIKKQQKRQNKTFYGKIPKQKQPNLHDLLKKMDDFKNKFKAVKLDYKQEESKALTSTQLNKSQQQSNFGDKFSQNQPNTTQKKKLLKLVENITNLYREQAISQKKPNLTCIQDLGKIDSKFYNDLNQHKKNRMEKRLFQLYKYTVPQLDDMIQSKFRPQSPIANREYLNFNNGKEKKQEDFDSFSVTDNGDQQIGKRSTQMKKKRLTIGQKFRNLGTHMIKAYLQSKFYQVQPNYVYPAFWQQKQPFRMQGSYAFFKAIKINDLQCVRSFINIKLDYLYEHDMNGRTPLIYASLHNRQEIVAYFLSLGSNVDKTCGKRRTALFYALQNKNANIVQMLLQYGASPWSNQFCPYTKMIRQVKQRNQKVSIQILFSNAKKIYLATRLQMGSRKRQQFWHQNKKKIISSEKINF